MDFTERREDMNEEQVKKSFASRLTALRKNAGMTQIQLAESLNYSDKAVSKWERAESIPDAYTLLKIAKLFDVSLDALFYGEGTSDGVRHGHGKKKRRDPATRRTLHIFIPLISILGTYFISTVVFFIAESIPFIASYAPIAFMMGTLATFIILTVFSAIWWREIFQFFSISGIIWSAGGLIAMALYRFLNIAYIFIPCAILEIICILVYVFVYRLKKTKREAVENAKKSNEEETQVVQN